LTVRSALIVLNALAIVVIAAVVGFRVVSVRRNPEVKEPENLSPGMEDVELEGRKLERALGFALACAAVLAIGLPLYWFREPTRQAEELRGFDKRSIKRGEILYANDQMKAYDNTKSLRCANCHGVDGSGGTATFPLKADQTGIGRPASVNWRAPTLDTVLWRFTPEQVTRIITYGRPGTPMPAWGTAGGGPKGEQSINDLVNYLQHIRLTKQKAREQTAKALADARDDAQGGLDRAKNNLAAAQQAFASAPPDKRESAQKTVAAEQEAVQHSQARFDAVSAALANGEIGQGQLLFEANCARCHTRGWSYFDPTDPSVPLPAPTGSGAFGPKINDGDTLNQFPGDVGSQQQIDWVTVGVEANKAYGVRGISSGRMPHFANVLTKEQIQAIVRFERTL